MGDVISVILCHYNGRDYINEQVDSISKSFSKLDNISYEVDIYDDGSDESSLANLYQLNFYFSNVNILKGGGDGVIRNFISAIVSEKYDDCDLIFLSDQDDIWCSDKAYQYLSAIKSIDNSKPILICSDSFVVDEHGNELSSSFFNYQGLSIDVMRDDSILFKNCVQGASVALNREMVKLLKQSLDIVDINKIVMHDWWLAILAKYYGEVVFLDKPLLKYRQHGNNQVGARKRSNRLIQVMRSPIKYAKSLIKTFNQAMAFFTLDMSLNQGISFKLENNGSPALNIKYIGLTKKILVKIMVFLYFFRF